ncbi:hypothetical protein D3C75_999640 [compost metagenome]
MPGGVVVEAMEVKHAEQRGIVSLAEFAAEMSAKAPVFDTETILAAEYNTSGGDQLRLEVSAGEGSAALHNGKRISLDDYAV